MKNTIAREILDLKIGFDFLLEAGTGENFELKHKILYLISKNGKTPPKILIDILGVNKSNLAICCNALVKDGLISKNRELLNKREIYYYITTKGENLLNDKLKNVENSLNRLKNKDKIIQSARNLSKLID